MIEFIFCILLCLTYDKCLELILTPIDKFLTKLGI